MSEESANKPELQQEVASQTDGLRNEPPAKAAAPGGNKPADTEQAKDSAEKLTAKADTEKPVVAVEASAEKSTTTTPIAPKPAAAAKPEAAPPAPPEPGVYGKQLETAGIGAQHLGKDSLGIEMLALAGVDIVKGAQWLRNSGQFDLLLSCSGVDLKTHRQSVYHLYSLASHQTVAIKIDAEIRDGKDYSPSLCQIWPAADWHEREAYDLLGIHYDGHPNLQRILMPNDWLGHPLRKDYKVEDPRLVWNER